MPPSENWWYMAIILGVGPASGLSRLAGALSCPLGAALEDPSPVFSDMASAGRFSPVPAVPLVIYPRELRRSGSQLGKCVSGLSTDRLQACAVGEPYKSMSPCGPITGSSPVLPDICPEGRFSLVVGAVPRAIYPR